MSGRLTAWQATLLFVVDQNGPASVADVATHALADEPAVRSRLATLERRGLVARTYTGHNRGSSFAYLCTDAGRTALEGADLPPEVDGCDICGANDGHFRHCMFHPDVVARRLDRRATR